MTNRVNEVINEWKTKFKNKIDDRLPFATQRIKICADCEHFTETKFCNQCGCYMPLKTIIPLSKCPILKW